MKYYKEAADITINTDNKSIDDIAEEIIEKLATNKDKLVWAILPDLRRKYMKILVINGPNLNFLGIRKNQYTVIGIIGL